MVTLLQRYIRPCIVVYYFLLRFCKQVFWEKFGSEPNAGMLYVWHEVPSVQGFALRCLVSAKAPTMTPRTKTLWLSRVFQTRVIRIWP
jgi:hypothetical protein